MSTESFRMADHKYPTRSRAAVSEEPQRGYEEGCSSDMEQLEYKDLEMKQLVTENDKLKMDNEKMKVELQKLRKLEESVLVILKSISAINNLTSEAQSSSQSSHD